MKRISRIAALAAVLAVVAWAAVALASNQQNGQGAGGIALPFDAGGSIAFNSQYLMAGTQTNQIETVSSSATVDASTIPAWPGSVIAGTTTVACMSITACSGGSAGDWYTRTFQWTAIYAPASGGTVIESGPTTIGVVSNGTSMSGVTSTAVASGTDVVIQLATESSCTVDCNVSSTWLQVN